MLYKQYSVTVRSTYYSLHLDMNMETEVQHYIFSPLIYLNTDNFWEKSHGESRTFKKN